MTDYVYSLVGNLDQVRLPNGVVSDYDYDNLNRLTHLLEFKDTDNNHVYDGEELNPVDILLAEYDYDLAADGKRTGVTETDAQGTTNIDWFYDDLGRLTREVYDSYDNDLDFTADYTYDLAGNRLSKKTDSDPSPTLLTGYRGGDPMLSVNVDEEITYGYDANDRLLTEAKDATGTANDTYTVYGYDTGNAGTQQTSKTVHLGDDANDPVIEDDTYTYNLQGRMASAEVEKFDSTGTLTEHTLSEYKYGDDGIRVEQKVTEDTDNDGLFDDETPVVTTYVNDGNNPTGYLQVLEEKDGTGAVKTSYTLGLDIIAQADAAGTNYFLLKDGHGSTRMLVDATGQPLSNQIFRYDAFGNRLDGNVGLELTNLLYSGEQTDRLIGWTYNLKRYYDPATGRFNRVDPWAGDLLSPLSLHKYLYCGGDPVNHTDPLGLYAIDFHYYVIQYILRSLGWPADEAHQVARFSQFVDDNGLTEAVDPTFARDFTYQSKEEIRAHFHFFGSTQLSATVRDDPAARSALANAVGQFYAGYQKGKPIDQLRAADVGIWLHIYADTYAHAGFTAWHNDSINMREGAWFRANTGHWDGPYGGHAADMVSLNPENHDKAVYAIGMIYDMLSKGNPYTPVRGRLDTLNHLSLAYYYHGVADSYGAEYEKELTANIIKLIDKDFPGTPHTVYNKKEISMSPLLFDQFFNAAGLRKTRAPLPGSATPRTLGCESVSVMVSTYC